MKYPDNLGNKYLTDKKILACLVRCKTYLLEKREKTLEQQIEIQWQQGKRRKYRICLSGGVVFEELENGRRKNPAKISIKTCSFITFFSFSMEESPLKNAEGAAMIAHHVNNGSTNYKMIILMILGINILKSVTGDNEKNLGTPCKRVHREWLSLVDHGIDQS